MTGSSKLGVVIVTYNSSDVVLSCLESLLAAKNAHSLAVVVVDNNSPDGTSERIQAWARGEVPFENDAAGPVALSGATKPISLHVTAPGKPSCGQLTLIRSDKNGGYAYGVNQGIESLVVRDDICAFWVLNPDSVVPPGTPKRLSEFAAQERFGLAGGRCRYYEKPDIIQTDGGQVSRSTGVCSSIHAGAFADSTPLPGDSDLDFVSGAHLLVSRSFLQTVGRMPEEYFLYYEEVDWAFRRGSFSLRVVEGADIFHRGGSSIGSGTFGRKASAFSIFFNHRNRIWFVKKLMPMSYVGALIWSFAKCAQLVIRGDLFRAWALFRGVLNLGPPAGVKNAVVSSARGLAFPAMRSFPPRRSSAYPRD